MKFLVISSFKDSVLSLSPTVVRKAMEETIDILSQARKPGGGILAMYAIPGEGRVVSIQEDNSAEEMAEKMNGTPMMGLMNFEIHPLADVDVWTKSFMEYIKKAEKAMS